MLNECGGLNKITSLLEHPKLGHYACYCITSFPVNKPESVYQTTLDSETLGMISDPKITQFFLEHFTSSDRLTQYYSLLGLMRYLDDLTPVHFDALFALLNLSSNDEELFAMIVTVIGRYLPFESTLETVNKVLDSIETCIETEHYEPVLIGLSYLPDVCKSEITRFTFSAFK